MLHKRCNTDMLGILLIYLHSPGAVHPRDHAYISVKPLAAVLQPINVPTYVCIHLCCVCMHAYLYVHTYVCMFICYVDRPVVEITALVGGCGYVSISWTATGNNDVCSPIQYNVTLSSSTMNMTVSITSMNTHNFTKLPDDTQFTITVIGINVMRVVSDPVSTSVEINENCESMCKAPFKLYVYLNSL